jgi:inhibitor of cysteine peptidase
MKHRIVPLAFALSFFLSVVACSPLMVGNISLTVADAGKVINVSNGSVLTVTLDSNPTTGYSWTENATMSRPGVVQQSGHEYLLPSQAIPGRGGQEVWTFKAVAPGTAVVSMEYKRPFEPGNPPANTFNVTITVQ